MSGFGHHSQYSIGRRADSCARALTAEEVLGSRYMRIRHIRKLMAQHRVDADLRWVIT